MPKKKVYYLQKNKSRFTLDSPSNTLKTGGKWNSQWSGAFREKSECPPKIGTQRSCSGAKSLTCAENQKVYHLVTLSEKLFSPLSI